MAEYVLIGSESADDDAVFFRVEGELVKASKSKLLETEDTYFSNLLSGRWPADASGILRYIVA
jgi:hypothetical protein